MTTTGGNATLVLRDSMSPAAKFVEQLLTLHGMPFLSSAIGPVLSAYVRNPHSLEVPSRPPPFKPLVATAPRASQPLTAPLPLLTR